MSLADLAETQWASIVGTSPSLAEDTQRRLLELGFFPGTRVQCLRITPFDGPRVFKVADSIFSLDQKLASQVVIEEWT